MFIEFNNKKGIGTKEQNVSSAWFIFNYDDIDTVNNLQDLFKVEINEDEYNATFGNGVTKPISIDTEQGTHKYLKGEGDCTLNDVKECMIKLDIFISDTISGLLRTEKINLLTGKDSVKVTD